MKRPNQVMPKPRNTQLCGMLGRKRKTTAPRHSWPRATSNGIPKTTSSRFQVRPWTGAMTSSVCWPRRMRYVTGLPGGRHWMILHRDDLIEVGEGGIGAKLDEAHGVETKPTPGLGQLSQSQIRTHDG